MKVAEKKKTQISEKIKTSIVQVIVRGSCHVLRKFCIDNSTAKFISLVVQIYLAGFAIANSFEKTASDCYRKSYCVTRTRRVKPKKQATASSLINELLFKNIPALIQ